MAKKNSELIRTLKYACFAASAGVIQIVSTWILNNTVLKGEEKYYACYLIGLILSVIWNFTLNRKYTFKSANNVPIAMAKVAVYYLIFTPLSTWWTDALVTASFWSDGIKSIMLGGTALPSLLVQVGTMLINFITEFLYQRFFVFGKSLNTNAAALAEAEAEKEAENK